MTDGKTGTNPPLGKRWLVRSMCVDVTQTPPEIVRCKPELQTFKDEVIEPTNVLFAACETPWEVEDTYEAFWNRLNDNDETKEFATHLASQKVKVLWVRRIDG